MAWTWHYFTAAQEPAGTSQEFPVQADAEAWIGVSWQEVLESGVESVSLFEDDRLAYGPMGLRPA